MVDYTIIENNRIEEFKSIPVPNDVKVRFSLTKETEANIIISRMVISNIIKGKDKRKLVIIGPCSIHSAKAVIEYATKLKVLHDKYKEKIYIVLRSYISKPRTTIGWEGIVHDPDLDGSCRIEKGLFFTRKILYNIAKLDLPMVTEWLDPITPQYFSDLISFGVIGARMTESQIHRELVSGLSHPCGFKNGTTGDISIAANAIKCAKTPHTFLGCVSNGTLALVKTKGNEDCCCILRGGIRPNYDEENVQSAINILLNTNVNSNLIIDCSHGNSSKNFRNQSIVARNVVDQIQKGNKLICGIMLESHLREGCQELSFDTDLLDYGVSITDECCGWDESEELLEFIANNV